MTTHTPARSHSRRSTVLLWLGVTVFFAAMIFGAPAAASLVAGFVR